MLSMWLRLFIVTAVQAQKITGSLKSRDKIEELIREVQDCRWDALLLSETWRPNKAEIWESGKGHVYVSAGEIENNGASLGKRG